jgi:putative ABC transport system permease protein
MLVRATARQKEIAVRSALGASRLRVIRQLLTESVTLSLMGGGSGLLVAWWGLRLVIGLLPKDFPRLSSIKLDLPVLLFTLGVSLVSGVVFGLAPTWQVSKIRLMEALKATSRVTANVGNRLRGLLVISEIALSLVLLMGACLLFRSFLQLQSVEAGFNADHVLTLRAGPSGPNFREDAQFVAYYRQVEERLRRVPGVELVGSINELPLFKGPTFSFRVEGRPPLPIDRWPAANYRNASPDYFRALSIPIVRGRAFESGDHAAAPLVVVINQAVADQDFPGENPLGKRVNFGAVDKNGQPIWREIVGVVASVHNQSLDEAPWPEIYTSALQDPFPYQSFVIRASVQPGVLVAPVRQAIAEIDRSQQVADVFPMKTLVAQSVSQPRFNLTVLSVFAGIALLLSAAGVYGVMSYTVSQRTGEIVIRVALGAGSGDVLGMVLGQGLILAGVGMLAGVLGALILTRYLTSLLFGVSATDAITFSAIPALLSLVVLTACYIPARRALRVDPVRALRYE